MKLIEGWRVLVFKRFINKYTCFLLFIFLNSHLIIGQSSALIINTQNHDNYSVDHVLNDFEQEKSLVNIKAEGFPLRIHACEKENIKALSFKAEKNKTHMITFPCGNLAVDPALIPYLNLNIAADAETKAYVYLGFSLKNGRLTIQNHLQTLSLKNHFQNAVFPIIDSRYLIRDFLDNIQDIHIFISVETETDIYIDNIIIQTSSTLPEGYLLKNNINPLGFDSTAPLINIVLIDEKEILAGDYVSNQPLINVNITEESSGLATFNIALLSCGGGGTVNIISGNGSGQTGADICVTANAPAPIPNGMYYYSVTACDMFANCSDPYLTPTFNIGSELKLDNALNGPNPFNPNNQSTYFQYQLSQDASLEIIIYSISGEIQFHKKINQGETGGITGFNSVEWDGKNRFGETVANGPYLAYLIANNESGKQTAKVKILVLK
ncbi:hypothetical protein ACFL96_05560 [Thermoproteota archaeon]